MRFAGKQPIVAGINTKEKGFVIEVDEDLLEELGAMDVDRDEALVMLKNNKHNCITTTYYLLQKKR